MRGLRSTLVLLVVLVGLVAYIFFVDRNRPVGEEEPRENVFATVPAEDIDEIVIRAEDGETSRLRRADDTWSIVEPVAAPADEGEVSSITSALADLEIVRAVDDNPADIVRYGLEPPRIEVEFRAAGQSAPNRLLLGDRTPTGGGVYAKTPDSPRVFLVDSFLDSTFNKNTFALRDKSILEFERDKVETLELTRGGTVLQFEKSGTEWRIARPIAARGDFGTIEGIVERLNSAQMQGIVAPEADNLRQYGLDRPSATMTVGTGSARATLLLGRTENAVVFAKDAARPVIFTVAPTIETDVFKDMFELRRKDLFDSRSFTAERVEMRRGDATMVFEKAGGAEGETEVWKDASGNDVDAERVQDLLGRLTGLRADSFEDAAHPSLKSPVLTVTVRYDKEKTETVRFGRSGMDVFASRADEPGAAKLDAQAFDEAIKPLDEMK